MRKALFTLGMIAAAFAGGAAANGQGLALARALIRTLANRSDFVRVVDSPEKEVPETKVEESVRDVPSAPMPPPVVDRPKAEPEVKESAKPETAPPSRPVPSPEPPKAAESVLSAAPTPPDPLPASAVEISAPMPAPVSEAPPRDAPLVGTRPPAEIQPPRPPRPEADEATSRAVLTSAVADPPLRSKSFDWRDLRKRMAQAGVTRFEVDAELQGRVRFRCVIPVAGRRAVAQIFEGEGVDEFQAAESALKRVQLWRVSEGSAAAN